MPSIGDGPAERHAHSQLTDEIAAIPHLVRSRITGFADVDALAIVLRRLGLRFVITIGRGSSDAVCEAVGRAAGVHAGLIAASLPPSLVTLDHARLDCRDALAIVVSQSGRSPDIIAAARTVRAGGAHVVGIINAPGSPLAAVCDDVLLAGAAPEISVAATKSVVLSWLIGLRLIAGLGHVTLPGWAALPDVLTHAVSVRPSASVLERLDAPQMVVLGRGSSLAAAREVALKIKELAGIDAEAISSAEVMHGPRAAIGPETALLALATAAAPLDEALGVLASLTTRIVVAGPAAQAYAAYGDGIVVPAAPFASADPVVTTAALYPLAMALALRRGRDPDQPRGLSKVTLTR
jgi:glutamine---fructose-6-phosphate transaminase (isomerizing)